MALQRVDLTTDVLVVGSGAAGMMAAIKAAAAGADVTLVTKGGLRQSSTQIAIGGFAAAFGHADPRDNPDVHLADSLRASEGLADPRLPRIMTERILGIALELESWGAGFVKLEDGRFLLKSNANHSYPRTVNRYDNTGPEIVATLVKRLETLQIKVLEHAMIADVVLESGRVIGAWGLDVRGDRLLAICTGAVVLATGGGSYVFYTNDNTPAATGDGYGVALRAGAKLADMEMVEFQLGVVSPAKFRGFHPHTNALLVRGARLYNGLGERFMRRYDPERLEATHNRALVCRAVGIEIQAGRATPAGGAYLDLSDGSPELERLNMIQPLRKRFGPAGVDLSYQPIEVAPAAHTFMGGVAIDETCATGIPGLYAAGETAGRVHGARRLGGNALADALVFGAIAGEAAASQERPAWNIDLEVAAQQAEQRLGEMERRDGGPTVEDVRVDLRKAMDQDVTIPRQETQLTRALETVRRLRREVMPAVTLRKEARSATLLRLRDALELENMLLTAEAVTESALTRKESRGNHYRSDFTDRVDPEWRRNIFVELRGGELVAALGPVNEGFPS